MCSLARSLARSPLLSPPPLPLQQASGCEGQTVARPGSAVLWASVCGSLPTQVAFSKHAEEGTSHGHHWNVACSPLLLPRSSEEGSHGKLRLKGKTEQHIPKPDLCSLRRWLGRFHWDAEPRLEHWHEEGDGHSTTIHGGAPRKGSNFSQGVRS